MLQPHQLCSVMRKNVSLRLVSQHQAHHGFEDILLQSGVVARN